MLMFRSLGFGLLALANCARGLALTPSPTPTRFSNSTTLTSSGSPSATTSECCFVVLDTIYENWWQEISTSTYYNVVNLTSITTLVTPYPTVTSTNYETHVYVTNATFYTIIDIGYDPISLYSNAAPGPKEISTILNANGTLGLVNQQETAITTAGTVIQSPQAFWAYSTVRIITAEAVTDSSGNKACGTTSAWPSVFTGESASTLGPNSVTWIIGGSTTVSNEPFFTGVNSNVGSYFYTNLTATQTGVVISLSTPFVYAPTRGATLVSGEPSACFQGSGTENYGYPVQTLLDYLVKNPIYSSQYPGLEHCLPGGPEILQLGRCDEVSPAVEGPGGDLTSSTIITVTPTGVTAQPASAASPTTASPTQTAATETAVPLPSSSSTSEAKVVVPSQSSPSPSVETPVQTPTQLPNTEAPSPTVANPPSSSPNNPTVQAPSPSTSPNAPAVSSPPSNPNNSASPNAPAASSPPSSPNSASPNAPAAPLSPSSNSPASSNAISPGSSSQAVIASVIASLIGASPITASPTLISGTSDLVISGKTTVPVNPAVPLSGSTTVINGVTNVIISSATTVPVSQLVASLPGSTTLVSGTLNVVLGTGATPTTVPLNSNVPGLVGSTIVSVSGSSTRTFVVVSTPETVPVVLGQPTKSAAKSGGVVGGGNANSTAPVQVTSSAPRTQYGELAVAMLCGMLVLGLVVF